MSRRADDRDFSGTANFVLGGRESEYTAGTMDAFRVYDRALLKEEIADMAAGP